MTIPSFAFATAANYAVNHNPNCVAVGDMSGNGYKDIIVGEDNNCVTVFTNDGSGGFSNANEFYAGAGAHTAIAILDADQDGNNDIVVSTFDSDNYRSYLFLLKNDGSGGFDFNQIYRNNYTWNGIYSIEVGDLNGDNKSDFVIADLPKVCVFLNNGTGGFTTQNYFDDNDGSEPACFYAAVGDLNGDGINDIAVTIQQFDDNGNLINAHLTTLINNGSGSFNVGNSYLLGSDYSNNIVISDLDGDGLNDIVVSSNTEKAFAVLKNTGSGAFASAVKYNVGDTYTVKNIVCSDFNGDGKADVVVVVNTAIGDSAGKLLIYANNGDGTFNTTPQSFNVTTWPQQVAVADFNGDGKEDLVVVDFSNSAISVLLNDGTFGNAGGGAANTVTLLTSGTYSTSSTQSIISAAGVTDTVTLLTSGTFYLSSVNTVIASSGATDTIVLLTSGKVFTSSICTVVADSGVTDTVTILNSGWWGFVPHEVFPANNIKTGRSTDLRRGQFWIFPIHSGSTVYKGGMVQLFDDGVAPVTSDGGRAVGVVAQVLTDLVHRQSLPPLVVQREAMIRYNGMFLFDNSSINSISEVMIGSNCYIEDDHTVANNGTAVAGKVMQIASDGVWVLINESAE